MNPRMEHEFAKTLLAAYAQAANEIGDIAKEWIERHWQRLICHGLLDSNGHGLSMLLADASKEWAQRNILISRIVEHVRSVHIADAAAAHKNHDAMGVLRKGFLELINIFIAVKVGYTIRVVFSADGDLKPGGFDVNFFPFLNYSEHKALKNPVHKRIMQFGFADGSYLVDFEAPGMGGIIGEPQRTNLPFVVNDVPKAVGDRRLPWASRTADADTELGISSIAYFPICPATDPEATVLIGVYTPVIDIFSPDIDPNEDWVQEIRHSLAGVGAFAKLADATETGLKTLVRKGVFQTVERIVDESAMIPSVEEAAERTIESGRLQVIEQQFLHMIKDRLLSYVGHHGKSLLAFVRNSEARTLKLEDFDLLDWWNHDVPEVAAQALASLRNYFECDVVLPRKPVIVRGDRDALSAVFRSLVHNAVRDGWSNHSARQPIHVAISGPSDELHYGVITVDTPSSRLEPPRGLTSAEYAILLRQGVPLPTPEGHGFGLYWSRCFLDAFNGRLHVTKLREPHVLSDEDIVQKMVDDVASGKDLDDVMERYRKGASVRICLQLAR